MKIILSLERSEQAAHSACAWFLPGADVRRWLDIICASPWNQDDLRIAILCAGSADPTIRGALLIPKQADPKPHDGSGLPAWRPSDIDPLAQSFGVVGGSVYLPVDARLSSPVADRQWPKLIPHDDAIYLWRPLDGLTEYPRAGLLRVADLLAAPIAAAGAWDAAQPGVACNTRLRSLQPEESLGFEAMLEQAAEDIGQRAGEWKELPADPSEPLAVRAAAAAAPVFEAIGNVGSAIRRVPTGVWIFAVVAIVGAMLFLAAQTSAGSIASMLLSLFGLLVVLLWVFLAISVAVQIFRMLRAIGKSIRRRRPSSARPALAKPRASRAASSSRWSLRKAIGSLPGVAAVNQFVKNKINAARKSIAAARQRAVARLLYTLESDPDIGLKFAIPLTSEPGRGIAPPGASLNERQTDFSLGRLRGGRPVDAWNLDHQWRAKLQKRYEELAKREIALGRHRRAAYIYAELLRNYPAAASVLASGGAYREAAVLYEEKLDQPEAAADCLRRGGLLTEAIEIYKRLGNWEIVGDLHVQLDQPEEARRAYEEKIARDVINGDFLDAARIAEEKLDDYEAAWQHLRAAWPASGQAKACLRASFQLTARRADHARALQQLEWSRSLAASAVLETDLAGLFAEVAGAYPEMTVRHRATDEARLIAAAHLQTASSDVKSKLTDALSALAPDDRLLARDCRRIREPRPAPVPVQRPTRHPDKPAGKVELVRQWSAPFDECLAAIGDGKWFVLAGCRRQKLFVARGNTAGKWQHTFSKPWNSPLFTEGRRFLQMAWNGVPSSTILVHRPLTAPLFPNQTFPITDSSSQAWSCGSARGIDRTTAAVAYGQGGQVVLASQPHDGPLQISRYAASGGDLLSSMSFPAVPLSLPCKLAVQGDRKFFAAGASLWELSDPNRVPGHDLADEMTDLVVSRHHSLLRIAVGTASGVDYFVGNAVGAVRHFLASEVANARVAFTQHGELLIAGSGGLQVYQTNANKPTWLAAWTDPGWTPIAVLPLNEKGTCIVVTSDGKLHLFRW